MYRKQYLKFVNYETYNMFKFGLFCVDKEKFKTSAEVVELVKNSITLDTSNEKRIHKLKIGHGGTLDSSATGVLVIGTGKGCQLLTKFLHGEKVYVVKGKFGEATDTFNAEGIITQRGNYSHISKSKFLSSLEKFVGEILQVPPLYCALKRNGERISDLVRSGVKIVLHPRAVKCTSIECLKLEIPYFTLRVTCGGGFYVRSLVHDLGLSLGSFAHVIDLRREKQGPFTLEDCLLCNELNVGNIISAISRAKNKA